MQRVPSSWSSLPPVLSVMVTEVSVSAPRFSIAPPFPATTFPAMVVFARSSGTPWRLKIATALVARRLRLVAREGRAGDRHVVGGDIGGKAFRLARLFIRAGFGLFPAAAARRLRERGIERGEREAARQQGDQEPARQRRAWFCEHAR